MADTQLWRSLFPRATDAEAAAGLARLRGGNPQDAVLEAVAELEGLRGPLGDGELRRAVGALAYLAGGGCSVRGVLQRARRSEEDLARKGSVASESTQAPSGASSPSRASEDLQAQLPEATCEASACVEALFSEEDWAWPGLVEVLARVGAEYRWSGDRVEAQRPGAGPGVELVDLGREVALGRRSEAAVLDAVSRAYFVGLRRNLGAEDGPTLRAMFMPERNVLRRALRGHAGQGEPAFVNAAGLLLGLVHAGAIVGVLWLQPGPAALELCSVDVDTPGLGHGVPLLAVACAYADRLGVPLSLTVLAPGAMAREGAWPLAPRAETTCSDVALRVADVAGGPLRRGGRGWECLYERFGWAAVDYQDDVYILGEEQILLRWCKYLRPVAPEGSVPAAYKAKAASTIAEKARVALEAKTARRRVITFHPVPVAVA